MNGHGIRIDKGSPDAEQVAAVVAVLCARGAALAAARDAGRAAEPEVPPWPRSAAGGRPASVGWSLRAGTAWRPV
ncbi:hypothetical protein GCM10010218_58670 [Streptomyces mashuensis]|uniref:Acyl-CoA carboxylase subunit epsilon n=1 Tax=Streptomyces mashuensis TaxID=33904 RepID=A0A919BA27_9ACTN|nr:acyl-CoA carboxylase epsilon subunit [Streptomyces mashuensis]GHF69487.1 hypothetical protein GCM10010218_58670 [Streptomyces mashuensis]